MYGMSIAYCSSSGMHRLGLLLSPRIPASRSFASTSQSRALTGLQGDQYLIALNSSKHYAPPSSRLSSPVLMSTRGCLG